MGNKKLRVLTLLLFLTILAVFANLFFAFVRISNKPAISGLPEQAVVNFANNLMHSCEKDISWRNCYGEKIAEINKKIDFSDSLKVLDKLAQSDKKTRDCHLIAHWLAQSEAEKNPRGWIKIFDYVDQTTCNNAYIHGVLEGRNRADPSFKIDTESIIEMCELIDEKTSKRLGVGKGGSDDACGHIMGHIILADSEGDIPASINTCDKLPHELKISCFQGVFMENITRENLEIHIDAEKLEFIEEELGGLQANCSKFTGDAGKSCWREMSHFFTIIAKYNPLESYNYCYENLNVDFAQECYFHSINLLVLSADYSSQDLYNTCINYKENPTLLKTCVARVLSPLIGSSVEFIDRAIAFCEVVPENTREFCYATIGLNLKLKLEPGERITACRNVANEFRDQCASL